MKIFCIARNYVEHVDELKMGSVPSAPVFFMKPDTALLRNNDPFYVPSFSREVHYECELVVRINRVGKCIAERFAHRYYDEVGLGIDFTARDVQRAAAAAGEPWEAAKAFDHSAAISPKFRQSASTAQMIFTVDQLISHISQFVTLKIGDLIYTGTPVGVGEVREGDELTATLEGHELLNFDIR